MTKTIKLEITDEQVKDAETVALRLAAKLVEGGDALEDQFRIPQVRFEIRLQTGQIITGESDSNGVFITDEIEFKNPTENQLNAEVAADDGVEKIRETIKLDMSKLLALSKGHKIGLAQAKVKSEAEKWRNITRGNALLLAQSEPGPTMDNYSAYRQESWAAEVVAAIAEASPQDAIRGFMQYGKEWWAEGIILTCAEKDPDATRQAHKYFKRLSWAKGIDEVIENARSEKERQRSEKLLEDRKQALARLIDSRQEEIHNFRRRHPEIMQQLEKYQEQYFNLAESQRKRCPWQVVEGLLLLDDGHFFNLARDLDANGVLIGVDNNFCNPLFADGGYNLILSNMNYSDARREVYFKKQGQELVSTGYEMFSALRGYDKSKEIEMFEASTGKSFVPSCSEWAHRQFAWLDNGDSYLGMVNVIGVSPINSKELWGHSMSRLVTGPLIGTRRLLRVIY